MKLHIQSGAVLESDFCCRHLSPCDTSKQDQRKESYESFALKFPKSLGTPATTQGRSISLSSVCLGLGAAIGAQMLPENSRLKKLAIVSATIATIAGTVPYILGLSDQLFAAGNAGPAPSWLTDHLNSLYSSTGITAKLLRTSQFSEVLSQIEQAIKNSTPVIPLIVFNALAWHFITVIGFNSETNEVLILDTNSHIAILTEKQLTVLMDVGFLPQDSWPTYLVAKLVDTTSTLGRYNLIEFHKPRRDLKQNEDSND
ncbi:MAG: hypothetical protein KA436_05295 [Oligoflexales bacterium]|nr:hypothetical protein [Oligoflexales bacterium]